MNSPKWGAIPVNALWLLWFQGFNKAPYLVRRCLDSWERQNSSDWPIIRLDADNLDQYIDFSGLRGKVAEKSRFTLAALSDVVRIELLHRHGGVWADATLFCRKPLNSWLTRNSATDFFAFRQERDRKIASWFLYARQGSYVLETWRTAVHDYIDGVGALGNPRTASSLERWRAGDRDDHYFWLHYLFGDLLQSDQRFSRELERLQLPSADPIHRLLHLNPLQPLNDALRAAVDDAKEPMHKLTYRYDEAKYGGSVLQYLLERQNGPSRDSTT